MTSERHEELASLYAFDLLEGPEKFAFEAELAGSGNLRAMVDNLRHTASDLSLTARQIEPPAALKSAILAGADGGQPAGHSSGPQDADLIPFAFNRLLPWAAAACFGILAAWFGVRTNSLQAEIESLHTQRELAEVAYKMSQAQLAERTIVAERMINDLGRKLQHTDDLSRLRITALASLLTNSADARAIAVWDPEQQSGLMTVEKLPAIAAEQDYQIWVIDPQYPIPVDGGVFKPDATGKAVLTFKGDKPIKSVAAFAISLEKKGGVPKAEGPLVLLGRQ